MFKDLDLDLVKSVPLLSAALIVVFVLEFFWIRKLNYDMKDQSFNLAFAVYKVIDVLILILCIITRLCSSSMIVMIGQYEFWLLACVMKDPSKAPKLGSHKTTGLSAVIFCMIMEFASCSNMNGSIWILGDHIKTMCYMPQFQFDLRENSYGYDKYKIIMLAYKALLILSWIFDCCIFKLLSIIVQFSFNSHFLWNIYPDLKKSIEKQVAINAQETN